MSKFINYKDLIDESNEDIDDSNLRKTITMNFRLLQEGATLYTLDKVGNKTFFKLDTNKSKSSDSSSFNILVFKDNVSYSLTKSDFIELYGKSDTYILEDSSSSSQVIDTLKDEEFYKWKQ